MADRTDLELLRDVRGGDAGAFNELVRRYQERVYWVARRIVGSHEEADDIVQEVFVRVYSSLGRFRGDSAVYTWIYRIAANMSLNALRKKKLREFVRLDDLAGQISADVPQPDEPLAKKEFEDAVQAAIERLPPRQKMVFVMRTVEEMPYEEMARITKRSVGGLKASYFHALRKVRSHVRKVFG